MASTLSALPVGSKVTLPLGGQPCSFVIVHQGNPDPALYDASCTGTWLMMESLYGKQSWGSVLNYAGATSQNWLNDIVFPQLDSDLQSLVQKVKLPYADGSTVHSGADGLECRLFQLSAYELGWNSDYKSPMPADGTCLDYFKDYASIDSRRIAQLNGSPEYYWTRTPCPNGDDRAWLVVRINGDCTSYDIQLSYGIRPVLVFSSSAIVGENGDVQSNSAPVITSPSGITGTNLGIQTGPFQLDYTAADPEGSTVHLTERLDDKTTRTLEADSGTVQQFQAVGDSQTFLRLSNAAHSLAIVASDGELSSQLSLTFTKAVTRSSLTLVQPIPAESPIQVASLAVEGDIPSDAGFQVLVTNNALDDDPVWQDVTGAVRRGYNILFASQTAARQPAFNFRIQVARGSSGVGGYIDQVTGAFQ